MSRSDAARLRGVPDPTHFENWSQDSHHQWIFLTNIQVSISKNTENVDFSEKTEKKFKKTEKL